MSSRDHHQKGRIESWLDSIDPFRGVYDTAALAVLGLAVLGLIGMAAIWWRFGGEFIDLLQAWLQS